MRSLLIVLVFFHISGALAQQSVPSFGKCKNAETDKEILDCSVSNFITFLNKNMHKKEYHGKLYGINHELPIAINFSVGSDGLLKHIRVYETQWQDKLEELVSESATMWRPGNEDKNVWIMAKYIFRSDYTFDIIEISDFSEKQRTYLRAIAEDDFEKGSAALQNGDYLEAAKRFENYLKYFITNKNAIYNLALCYLGIGDSSLACYYFDFVRTIGDEDAGFMLNKYCNFNFQEAENRAQLKKPQQTNIPDIPSFPGGDIAMKKYFIENLNYPDEARREEILGTVTVKFVVDKDGNIKYAEVARGIGYGCDEEALRLINEMPKWIPAANDMIQEEFIFNIPIIFNPLGN